jgi:hypothetical protein
VRSMCRWPVGSKAARNSTQSCRSSIRYVSIAGSAKLLAGSPRRGDRADSAGSRSARQRCRTCPCPSSQIRPLHPRPSRITCRTTTMPSSTAWGQVIVQQLVEQR